MRSGGRPRSGVLPGPLGGHAQAVPPRLVIGLSPGADRDLVRSSLRTMGVLAGPSAHPAELPDVLVAEADDVDNPEGLLARIRAVDGVDYAHQESLLQGFGDVTDP